MRFTFAIGLTWSLALIQRVKAVDSTDTLMEGGKPDSTKAHLRISNLRLRTTDSSQSGYLPNHNMDPNIITGGSFGQIWQFKASIAAGVAEDQYYSKPLIYTPSNYGRQVVLVFSEANWICVLDAQNGR